MKQAEFVTLYYPHAYAAQKRTGISATAILAQAALESGWGKAAPGNMFFGIKDTDGKNGNEQLLVTTEYSRRADLKFPEIISITPQLRNGQKWFKYKVKDYFRKYDTAEECFVDHCNFFYKNKRYAKALQVKANATAFIKAIAEAGYATDPAYTETLLAVAKKIDALTTKQKTKTQ